MDVDEPAEERCFTELIKREPGHVALNAYPLGGRLNLEQRAGRVNHELTALFLSARATRHTRAIHVSDASSTER